MYQQEAVYYAFRKGARNPFMFISEDIMLGVEQVSVVEMTSNDNNSDSRRIFEPRHDISNYVVCATSKASDQHAHTRGLIRAFASRLNIL